MSDEPKTPNIRIGGSVSGGNFVIGGEQTVHGNLSIRMGTMPAASEDARQQLEDQLKQLMAELGKAPPEQTKDVKAVQMAAQDAVTEADQPQPDKERLQIRGEALMQAAKNLAAVAPIAVQIAKTLLMIG